MLSKVTNFPFSTEFIGQPFAHITTNYTPFFAVKCFPVEFNLLGLRPGTFNCQLKKLKRLKEGTFNIVKLLPKRCIPFVNTKFVAKQLKGQNILIYLNSLKYHLQTQIIHQKYYCPAISGSLTQKLWEILKTKRV